MQSVYNQYGKEIVLIMETKPKQKNQVFKKCPFFADLLTLKH